MIDIIGISSRFIGDLVRVLKGSRNSSDPISPCSEPEWKKSTTVLDDIATQALTTIFGMDAEGKIKKEKARNVVAKLGLLDCEDDDNGFELPNSYEEEEEEDEDDFRVEEVVGDLENEDSLEHTEMLRRAFTVFDEDGDGYIDALEVKRVVECLGLGNGWDVVEFEKMVEMADLNFDGKVDFSEFELMMGENV